MRVFWPALIAALLYTGPGVRAQATDKVEFDVVSIKRNVSGSTNGGGRTLPDGTFMMTNQPIRSVINLASPEPVEEILGLPDWAASERYDVIAKPPSGSTPDQRRPMWQAVFAERMKLVAHVEDRERDTFSLTLARSDGRLGPQLKPSTLDCSPQGRGAAPPTSPPPTQTADDFANGCGARVGINGVFSGSMSIDVLAGQLRGLAGGRVVNRTGLQGAYSVRLTYANPRLIPAPDAPPNDLPNFYTALEEQLGLKLKAEKSIVRVLVVDSIERPSAD